MRRADRLRLRSQFQKVLNSGHRVTRPEFVLYHFAREASGRPRVGLTVGRRVGGAVARNRARRLLREAVRPLLPRLVACDIVIVARPGPWWSQRGGIRGLEGALADAAARAGLLRTT